jgi:hypothetical protein
VQPMKKSKPDEKLEAHRKDAVAETRVMQPVLRMVQERFFVHCYLACGHMVTMRKEQLAESFPFSIECWACEEESKKRCAEE